MAPENRTPAEELHEATLDARLSLAIDRMIELATANPDAKCHYCEKPATCFATSAEGVDHFEYGCDEHCGHGNEDSRCTPMQTRNPARVVPFHSCPWRTQVEHQKMGKKDEAEK